MKLVTPWLLTSSRMAIGRQHTSQSEVNACRRPAVQSTAIEISAEQCGHANAYSSSTPILPTGADPARPEEALPPPIKIRRHRLAPSNPARPDMVPLQASPIMRGTVEMRGAKTR